MGRRLGVHRSMFRHNLQSLYVGQCVGASNMIHLKAATLTPSYKCEVRVVKAQDVAVTSEINTMLAKGNIELGPGNKVFFTYPFMIPKKNGAS